MVSERQAEEVLAVHFLPNIGYAKHDGAVYRVVWSDFLFRNDSLVAGRPNPGHATGESTDGFADAIRDLARKHPTLVKRSLDEPYGYFAQVSDRRPAPSRVGESNLAAPSPPLGEGEPPPEA